MPKFKVLLEQSQGIYGGTDKPLNPFAIRDIFSASLHVRMAIREFVFDADDEKHALRLYEEAKQADISNVRGFRLRSIEEITGRELAQMGI